MFYASICAIIKDEDKDIMEWLHHHFSIGFEHILIFDNNSRIPLKKTLSEYIDAGIVTVEDCPLQKAQQLSAYMSALKYWGHNTKWLAFIDVDEFIMPLIHNDIRDLLDEYRQYGGIGANWAMFSSNRHVKRPAGGILANYTACLGLNPHIKSIVQPAVTQIAKSAHHFTYSTGKYCVNEDEIPIPGFLTYPVASKIRINHYYYKSFDDFQEKIARGLVTQMKSGAQRSIADFNNHLDKPTCEDRHILKFNPQMEKMQAMPIATLAATITEQINPDLESALTHIDKLLELGDQPGAFKKSLRLARYNADPLLDKIIAKLRPPSQNTDKLLNLVKTELANADFAKQNLDPCYQNLAEYYRIHGKMEKAKTIDDWLASPRATVSLPQ